MRNEEIMSICVVDELNSGVGLLLSFVHPSESVATSGGDIWQLLNIVMHVFK